MYGASILLTWGIPLLLLFLFVSGGGVAVALFIARRRSQPLRSGRWAMGILIGLLVMLAIPILALTLPAATQSVRARPAPVSPTAALYLFQIYPNADQQLISLNARDGSSRWTHPPSSDSGVNDTTLSDDTFYIVDPIPTPQGNLLHAIRTSDGAERWQVHVGSGNPDFRMDDVPIVADGMIYLVENTFDANRDAIVALHASDGVLAWSHPLDNSDAVQVAGAGLLFLGSKDGSVRALRSRDGSLAWQATLEGNFLGPVLGNDLIYMAVPDTREIVALRASDGKPAWTAPEVELGQLAFSGQHLYLMGETNVNAFDPTTGKLLWRHPLADWSEVQLDEQDGSVYVVDGPTLTAYRATDGSQRWRSDTGSPRLMYTTPVAIGGAVFVTTYYSGEELCVFSFFCEDPEYVTALSAKNGATYWTQRMDLAAELWATN